MGMGRMWQWAWDRYARKYFWACWVLTVVLALNLAARVEQLTKANGDLILLTAESVTALAARPSGLAERGVFTLKGKSAPVRVFGLNPNGVTSADRRLGIAESGGHRSTTGRD